MKQSLLIQYPDPPLAPSTEASKSPSNRRQNVLLRSRVNPRMVFNKIEFCGGAFYSAQFIYCSVGAIVSMFPNWASEALFEACSWGIVREKLY